MNPWLNSTDLIASIKRRAFIPIDQVTFTEQQLLDFANEEMQQNALPMVMELHEEYLTATASVSVSAGVDTYDIPYRAVGNKLRYLKYCTTAPATGTFFNMVRVDPKDSQLYGTSNTNNSFTKYFYAQNSSVILTSIPNSDAGALVFSYYERPGSLVLQDRVASVTGISVSGTNTVLACSSMPANIAPLTQVDFLQTLPGHKTYKTDYTLPAGCIDSVALTITIPTADIPTGFRVGDNVCTATEAFIPQIPTELHSILAQMVAVKCLEALGDQQGMQSAEAKLQQMKSNVGDLIDNRIESSPIKINTQSSPLKSNRWYRWFRSGF